MKTDGPVWNKKLLIDPRLGNLNYARGSVVREFGNVPVSWTRTKDGMKFTLNIPKGVTAKLKLSGAHQVLDFQLNHKKSNLKKSGDQYSIDLSSGEWSGDVKYDN